MEIEPIVRCVCLTLLAEPPNTPPERRIPCPSCGSKARSYSITMEERLVVADDVSTDLSAATARVSEPAVETHQIEDAGFDVTWLQLSDGGAWMVRVYARDGGFLDGAVADDPQDAILAVSERLLPGSEPPK